MLKVLNARPKGLSTGSGEPLRVLEQGGHFGNVNLAMVGRMGWR